MRCRRTSEEKHARAFIYRISQALGMHRRDLLDVDISPCFCVEGSLSESSFFECCGASLVLVARFPIDVVRNGWEDGRWERGIRPILRCFLFHSSNRFELTSDP